MMLTYPPLPQISTGVVKGDGMKRLMLASGSPRRKELLTRVFLSFDISVSQTNETFDPESAPDEVVQTLARRKAQDVAKRFPDHAVLGADTVVAIDGHILGKPADRVDAKAMLKKLSGRSHAVHTGVVIVTTQDVCCFSEVTHVRFWNLEDSEIDDYIETGEPFDKAGAYGIQGLGATLVKEIHGDYFNVVGLPLSRTVRALRNVGITSNHSQSRRKKTGGKQ